MWATRTLVLGTLIVAATAIVVWAVRRREREHPRCPRCGYAIRAGSVLVERCPECGFAPATAAGWRWGWRRSRTAFGAGLVACAATALLVGEPFGRWLRRTLIPRYATVATAAVGGHQVRLERDRWTDWGEADAGPPRRIVVRGPDGDTLVRDGFYLSVGVYSGVGATVLDALPPVGSPGFGDDLDGDGVADLLLNDPSGGSGGTTTTLIVSLGQRPRITHVDENIFFLPGPPVHALAADLSFRYRWTSGAGSPAPAVVWVPTPTGWALDRARSEARAPDAAALAFARRAIAEGAATGGREAWLAPLLRTTLDLVYAGRAEDARAFFRREWQGDEASRQALEAELVSSFRTGHFADDLRTLNGGDPWP